MNAIESFKQIYKQNRNEKQREYNSGQTISPHGFKNSIKNFLSKQKPDLEQGKKKETILHQINSH